MSTFVLVHGAWTGAHVWRPLRLLLAADGHEVFAPALTGLGERVHLASPETDLETHVQDVVNLLRYQDLREVVLVGHSYGGAVVCTAADREPDRIARLVLLDALLVPDGRSVQDVRRHTAPYGAWIPPPRFAHLPVEQLARLLPAARLSLQPANTFRQPVRLTAPLEGRPFQRWYVRAARRDPSPPYDEAARYTRAHQAWHYREVARGHDTMLSSPEETAQLLCSLAGTV